MHAKDVREPSLASIDPVVHIQINRLLKNTGLTVSRGGKKIRMKMKGAGLDLAQRTPGQIVFELRDGSTTDVEVCFQRFAPQASSKLISSWLFSGLLP